MFNKIQKKEFLCLAKTILESEKWSALPWDDAWRGAYPLLATDTEIQEEASQLELKASRIMSGGSLENEYSDAKEHIRMIFLESATSFNIYAE